MPDADLHGARYHGDADARLGRFWEILKQNIDELPQLESALRADNLIAGERFAVAGASMGGMTALGAMARYPQIQSVACLMGSGYFMQLSQSLFPPLVADTPEQQAQFAARMAPLADYDPATGWRPWQTVRCCCGMVRRMRWCPGRRASGWRGRCVTTGWRSI